MREDPAGATRRRRREQILGRIGWAVGLILGAAGVLGAMLLVQR